MKHETIKLIAALSVISFLIAGFSFFASSSNQTYDDIIENTTIRRPGFILVTPYSSPSNTM